jgi:hypothetical protein
MESKCGHERIEVISLALFAVTISAALLLLNVTQGKIAFGPTCTQKTKIYRPQTRMGLDVSLGYLHAIFAMQ